METRTLLGEKRIWISNIIFINCAVAMWTTSIARTVVPVHFLRVHVRTCTSTILYPMVHVLFGTRCFIRVYWGLGSAWIKETQDYIRVYRTVRRMNPQVRTPHVGTVHSKNIPISPHMPSLHSTWCTVLPVWQTFFRLEKFSIQEGLPISSSFFLNIFFWGWTWWYAWLPPHQPWTSFETTTTTTTYQYSTGFFKACLVHTCDKKL